MACVLSWAVVHDTAVLKGTTVGNVILQLRRPSWEYRVYLVRDLVVIARVLVILRKQRRGCWPRRRCAFVGRPHRFTDRSDGVV